MRSPIRSTGGLTGAVELANIARLLGRRRAPPDGGSSAPPAWSRKQPAHLPDSGEGAGPLSPPRQGRRYPFSPSCQPPFPALRPTTFRSVPAAAPRGTTGAAIDDLL